MFGDLKNKINQGKDELNKRMDSAYVRSASPSKMIEVIANGNRQIIDLNVQPEIYEDPEQFEDELIITLNQALEKADGMYQEEMKTAMKGYMPNIPGLDGLLD